MEDDNQSSDDLNPARGILLACAISAVLYLVAWSLLSRGLNADQQVIDEFTNCRAAIDIAERHATILDHVLAGGKLTHAGRTISCKKERT